MHERKVRFALLSIVAAFTSFGPLGAFAACVAPPAGLVSWWPANGDAGDVIGENNGILRDGATFDAGIVGQGFSLDGIDDYVEIADAESLRLENGDLSIEMWVKLTGPQAQPYDLIDKMVSPDGVASGYLLHTLSSGVIRFCFSTADIAMTRKAVLSMV